MSNETINTKIIETILSIPSEERTVEFKRLGVDSKIDSIIESVVAMGNTDGGYIILGVEDPEKTKLKGIERVFGIEENKELFDEIGRNISKIVPPLSLT